MTQTSLGARSCEIFLNGEENGYTRKSFGLEAWMALQQLFIKLLFLPLNFVH